MKKILAILVALAASTVAFAGGYPWGYQQELTATDLNAAFALRSTFSSGPLTPNAILLGNGGGDIIPLASLGSSGYVLTSNGPGVPPSFTALSPSTSSGTVTSVGLTAPAFLTVSGSPVTTAGTLAITATSEAANTVLIAPNGSSGAPTFRALLPTDVPQSVVATPAQFDSTTKIASTAFVQQDSGNRQAFVTISTTTSITASQSGMQILLATGAVPTLPAANSVPSGNTYYFQANAAGRSITRAGTDTIVAGSTTGLTSLGFNAGDTLELVSNGVNTWYAVGGSLSLPYAGVMSSANWTTAAATDSSTRLATTAFVNTATNGYQSISVAGSSNVTLTAAQAAAHVMNFTGAITASITVAVPAASKSFTVINNTTGAYTLTVIATGGTGIAVTQTKSVELYCDGTNVLSSFTDLATAGFPSLGANTFTGTQSFAVSTSYATPNLRVANIAEAAVMHAAGPATSDTIYVGGYGYSGGVTTMGTGVGGTLQFYTVAGAANWTENITWDSGHTFNSATAVGDSITLTLLVTTGSSGWCLTAIAIDGATATPKWLGGVSAPSSSCAVNSILAYTFTILKTAATPTYTVIGSYVYYQ